MLYTFTILAKGVQLDQRDSTIVEKYLESELSLRFSKVELSKRRVIDYILEPINPDETRELLKKEFFGNTSFDYYFQISDSRKSKKLFVFDMDSTLIYQEVIELIAAYANIEDKVAEITERAMNGELDFNDSLKERVLLLKGIDASTLWDDLKQNIRITKGAKKLCGALKKLGITSAVCSGGFLPLANYVKSELGLDYAYANQLSVDESNCLDGTTFGPIINGEKKASLLLQIANDHSINPSQAVAIGDGANDLKMMSVAGYGIAWNAKPKVQQSAQSCLNSDSLQDVLYIMGYNDAEIQKLTQ